MEFPDFVRQLCPGQVQRSRLEFLRVLVAAAAIANAAAAAIADAAAAIADAAAAPIPWVIFGSKLDLGGRSSVLCGARRRLGVDPLGRGRCRCRLLDDGAYDEQLPVDRFVDPDLLQGLQRQLGSRVHVVGRKRH